MRHCAAFSHGAKSSWMQHQLFEAALGISVLPNRGTCGGLISRPRGKVLTSRGTRFAVVFGGSYDWPRRARRDLRTAGGTSSRRPVVRPVLMDGTTRLGSALVKRSVHAIFRLFKPCPPTFGWRGAEDSVFPYLNQLTRTKTNYTWWFNAHCFPPKIGVGHYINHQG
jgi:hypothetical protein